MQALMSVRQVRAKTMEHVLMNVMALTVCVFLALKARLAISVRYGIGLLCVVYIIMVLFN